MEKAQADEGKQKRSTSWEMEDTCVWTGQGSILRLVLCVQQVAIAIDALEGIVGRAILVKTEVVPVSLFVFELLNVSPDDDTDI